MAMFNFARLNFLRSKPGLDDALGKLQAELNRWTAMDCRPTLLWRDDDLKTETPQLDHILDISSRAKLPVIFAAVPTTLTTDAAARVRAGSPASRIAVHGYRHLDHSRDTIKSEYPLHRDAEDVVSELMEAKALVQEKAGAAYLNLFVPPWNRFDERYGPLLAEAGYAAVSAGPVFFETPSLRLLQFHCQIATEANRTAIPAPTLIYELTRQLRIRRTSGDPTRPVGILTHHRHGDELLSSFEQLLDLIPLQAFELNASDLVDRASARLAPAEAVFQRRWNDALLTKATSQIAKSGVLSVLRHVHVGDLISRLPPGSRIVSGGCGPGLVELAIALDNPSLQLVCVDRDPNRFRYAEGMSKLMGARNIAYHSYDFNDGRAAELGEYDAVVLSDVLATVDQPAQLVQRLFKALKTDGVISCIEPLAAAPRETGKQRGFTLEQMRSLFSDFKVQECTPCYLRASIERVRRQWDALSASGNWTQAETLFALAGFDLAQGAASAPALATSVRVVASKAD